MATTKMQERSTSTFPKTLSIRHEKALLSLAASAAEALCDHLHGFWQRSTPSPTWANALRRMDSTDPRMLERARCMRGMSFSR